METVLITRPLAQSQSLAEALKEHGFKTIIFPTLLIVPASVPSTIEFEHTDIAIFVSPATVRPHPNPPSQAGEGTKKNSSSRPCVLTEEGLGWGQTLVLAIGKGTATTLEKANINVTAFADPANSETLLKHPLLQSISNKKIFIFCGENGKTLLQDTLRARGATVQVVYTHQSIMPKYDEASLTWQANEIDITVSTSLASLKNLRTMIEKYHRLDILKKRLVVISDAMKSAAPLLGFSNDILLADGADNGSILRMLL